MAMLPRLMELMLEYGNFEGLLRFLPSLPGTLAMFTFINKSIASGVKETMQTGEASYIGTGRPNANTHYSWKECYYLHVESHYYPALVIMTAYVLYVLLASDHGLTVLPMFIVLITSGLWICAPMLFCPQPTLGTLVADLTEFWQFLIATPNQSLKSLVTDQSGQIAKNAEDCLSYGIKVERATLYEFWLKKELTRKRLSVTSRVLDLSCYVLALFGCFMMFHSTMLSHMHRFFIIFSIHYMLMELWRITGRPTIIGVIDVLIWTSMPALFPLVAMVSLLITMSLVSRIVSESVLILAWIALGKPNIHWTGIAEKEDESRKNKQRVARLVLRYDRLVEHLYINLMTYVVHLYFGIIIMLCNLVVQAFLVLLEETYGFHSWLLLNPRLRSRGCCSRRKGYSP
eukprot:TRINITY_DN11506_c0_g1_i1.p1 TRINITY_DN11506_c0_g1~~TRINITY_DN11506_c0_g1_i1.p1  ORF type:complete len:444 (+),score=31.03 TRINITY_DN11506_c0_g1_i1:132-1334(+)